MRTLTVVCCVLLLAVVSAKAQLMGALQYSPQYANDIAGGHFDYEDPCSGSWIKGGASSFWDKPIQELVGSSVFDIIFVKRTTRYDYELSLALDLEYADPPWNRENPPHNIPDGILGSDSILNPVFGLNNTEVLTPGTYRRVDLRHTDLSNLWDLQFVFLTDKGDMAFWRMIYPFWNDVSTDAHSNLYFGEANLDNAPYLLFNFDTWDISSIYNVLDTQGGLTVAIRGVGAPVPEPEIYGTIGALTLIALVVIRRLETRIKH